VAAPSQKPGKPAAEGGRQSLRHALLSRTSNWIWRPVPLAVVAVSLTLLLFWRQLAAVLPDLSGRGEYQLTWSDLQVPHAGPWVPEDLLEQVRVQAGLPETLSVLDESLLEQIATAFSAHPWIAAVVSASKEAEGGVKIDLRYREPVLMVHTSRGTYPVDQEGVLLPPSDFSASDVDLFPRVDGVQTTPRGPAGQPWGDSAVIGAARLAAILLQPRSGQIPWKRYGFDRIAVLARQGPVASVENFVFGLTTIDESRIVWGHGPGFDALEPSVDQKLERLNRFIADNGGLQVRNEPVRIDVRDWQVIRWEVLSANGTRAIYR
jgi:hypothetical protein